MASTPPRLVNGHARILPLEKEIPHSPPILRPARRRTPSFSSSSRSNSWDSSFESSPFSFHYGESPPLSPVGTPLKFMGIPFSWEQIPGIPKNHQVIKKKDISGGGDLLPLPPAGNTSSPAKKWHKLGEISPKKHHINNRFKRDPFFAALVECSKDGDRDRDHDHDHGTNIWKGVFKINTRSLSDRFGFINTYTSCKSTCAVSESIVYLPRASPHYLLHDLRR